MSSSLRDICGTSTRGTSGVSTTVYCWVGEPLCILYNKYIIGRLIFMVFDSYQPSQKVCMCEIIGEACLKATIHDATL